MHRPPKNMRATNFLTQGFIYFLFIVFSQLSFGQNDPVARGILDKAADKANKLKSMEVTFNYTNTNVKTNAVEKDKGSLKIKGDKYHLSIPGSEIYFDGKDVYNYTPASNEVNITKPEPAKRENGDFYYTNPKDIFKIQSKDFLAKLLQEKTFNNVQSYEIDLYPVDLKTKYTRVRIYIAKASLEIVSVHVFLKEGINYEIDFSNYKTNVDIPDSEFVFDSKKYKNIVVNDLRF